MRPMPAPGASRIARRLAPWVLLAGAFGAALSVASGPALRRADFVFNNAVEVATLDPATVTGVPEGRILRAIYEGLLVLHPASLQPLPGQAESHTISEDGLVYTFTIREDARWSNGDPVTAHDFVFSFRRLLEPETAAEYAYQLWPVEGAEAFSTWPDDRYATHAVWLLPHAAAGRRASPLGAPQPGDRVRLGLAPWGTRPSDSPDDPAAPSLTPSPAWQALGRPTRVRYEPLDRELRAGDLVATVFDAERRELQVETPVSGRLTAANNAVFDDPRRLANDTFAESHWLVELELDASGAERLAQLPFGPAWRNQHLWSRVGIRALSERELELRLAHPTPYFLELTAFYPLYPVHRGSLLEAKKRWPRTWQVEWVKPENLVTNGPYTIRERRINDRIRLQKNPLYWDADMVAFRTIDALAVDHYGTALNLYLTGDCDWLNGTIPANLIPRLMEREDFNPAPYLGSYFYRINVTKPPLNDPRVRRALALTIDRDAITKNITKAGQRPLRSLVPQGMRGYKPVPFGFENHDEAKRLLVEAGYGSGGARFPTIELVYNTSETHRDVAEVVADSWRRHLGIDVQLQNQEWKVFLATERTLSYDVSRGAWIADYADPNTFLDLFVEDGENNRTGWSNAEYDRLIASAAREPRTQLRMEMLAEAERILMSELPILPIYAYAAQNLVNPRLGGFAQNSQDLHFPKFWFWKSDAELAQRKVPPKKERVEARGPKNGLYAPALREASQGASGPGPRDGPRDATGGGPRALRPADAPRAFGSGAREGAGARGAESRRGEGDR